MNDADDLPRILREPTPCYEAPDTRFWLAAPMLAAAGCLGLLYLARVACVDAMPFERDRCVAAAEAVANASPDKIGALIRELGVAP
jgi:hypothetical protein